MLVGKSAHVDVFAGLLYVVSLGGDGLVQVFYPLEQDAHRLLDFLHVGVPAASDDFLFRFQSLALSGILVIDREGESYAHIAVVAYPVVALPVT